MEQSATTAVAYTARARADSWAQACTPWVYAAFGLGLGWVYDVGFDCSLTVRRASRLGRSSLESIRPESCEASEASYSAMSSTR